LATPILFLHGWTMQGAVFDDLIASLGAEFECAAPDLPGHASAADEPATLDACAGMIARYIAGWPDRQVVLVGWSMGAAAAWRYIAQYGTDRLAGLVTIDMSPKIVPEPDWPHGLKGQTGETVAASTRKFAEDWKGAAEGIAATMFASPQGAARLSREEALRIILGQDPDRMRALWSDLVALDAREVIPRIDVPYLVCSGAKSRVYPASAAEWIVENTPDGRWHRFGASGHSPHLEEPEAFARVLVDFTQDIAA
jgi:pimeloyl-[acyl-carrier protein] methyl ester esterase